jgi:EF hand
MRKNIMLLLALGATTAVCLAQPQGGPPGGGRQSGGRPPQLPIITALDANHDGVIDSDEITNASTVLLTLDKNGDGKLTADEYLPARMADMPKDVQPAIVKALDANGDGVIDADEIANAPTVLKTLDKNGDGKLTTDELIGRPPQGSSGPPSDQN